MSDAVNFTEQEQDDLDNGDPVQALWRLENEARARRHAEVSDPSPRPV